MSRLVVVSNRVALPGEAAQRSGGLVTGLVDALHQAGGLWFGWSGKLGETAPQPNVFETEGVTYATVDLTRADHDGYYSGFSNAALWPLFHYRLDLMNFTRRDLAAYRRVNGLLAHALAPLLRPSDLIWVHDYHLILMAEELRRAGAAQRIGFFLHTPFPSLGVLATLPHGPVAGLVGIEGGVVSEVINLESSGVGAPDRRLRHDQQYHEDGSLTG